MIKANEARKQAESFTAKPRKWNIFDTLQLKRIERSIKFWSARGETNTSCGGLRPLVAEKLKKMDISLKVMVQRIHVGLKFIGKMPKSKTYNKV